MSGYELITNEGASLFSTNEVNLTLDSIKATAGDYISIPVTIAENEGIAGFNFRLDYDKNYLTPVAITKGDILADGTFTSNLTEDTDGSELDYITAYWNCAYDMTEDGELFVVDFLVNDNVEIGQKLPIQLSYENDGLCDNRLNDVMGITTQGEVEIVEDDDNLIVTSYISLGDETISDLIPQNQDFDLIVEIQKTIEQIPNAKLYVVTYKNNGALLSISQTNITNEMINEGMCDVHIQGQNDVDTIKVFIWDSYNNLMPLAESFVIQ